MERELYGELEGFDEEEVREEAPVAEADKAQIAYERKLVRVLIIRIDESRKLLARSKKSTLPVATTAKCNANVKEAEFVKLVALKKVLTELTEKDRMITEEGFKRVVARKPIAFSFYAKMVRLYPDFLQELAKENGVKLVADRYGADLKAKKVEKITL